MGPWDCRSQTLHARSPPSPLPIPLLPHLPHPLLHSSPQDHQPRRSCISVQWCRRRYSCSCSPLHAHRNGFEVRHQGYRLEYAPHDLHRSRSSLVGAFILAILSTLLHAATAAYHVIKDKRRTKTHNTLAPKETVHHDTTTGHLNGNGHHGHNQV